MSIAEVVKDSVLIDRLLKTIKWLKFSIPKGTSQEKYDEFENVVKNTPTTSPKEYYRIVRENYLKLTGGQPVKDDDELIMTTDNPKRAINRIKEIVRVLPKYNFNPKVYLDIGAGDMSITSTMATAFRIKKAYGLDVRKYKSSAKNVEFLQASGNKIPLPNSSVDLVTILMALHHMEKPELTIREVYRVLREGGIVVIREHDLINPRLAHLLDVIHEFYEYVFRDGSQDEMSPTNYKTLDTFVDMFRDEGFILLAINKFSGNPSEKFHACFAKPFKNGFAGGKSKKISKYISGLDARLTGSDDIPKDKIVAAIIPETISECSLVSGRREVCMSDPTLKMISEIIGADIPDKMTDEAKRIVLEKAKKHTNCDTERCVLLNMNIPSNIIWRELLVNYKIPGPTDTSLLSNIDIDETLIQWGYKFRDFYPNNFNMVDFESRGDTLATIDMDKDVYQKGYRCFGCVINTDKYSGKGKHWMALFVDMREDSPELSIEFYNSSSNKPQDSFAKWMVSTKQKLEEINQKYKLNKDVIAVKVAFERHQESQTECGVYSLFYVYARINHVPYRYFSENIVPDKWMFEMRQHLFYNPKPTIKGSKFTFEEFSNNANVAWEGG